MAQQLRIELVTPETTLLDETVEALRFPLYDGQFGVLPGRAPVVGRLGAGELRVTTSAGERRYFIAGGFLQIKGPVVCLLTNEAIPAGQLKVDKAQQELANAQAKSTSTDAQYAQSLQEQERARKMLSMAKQK